MPVSRVPKRSSLLAVLTLTTCIVGLGATPSGPDRAEAAGLIAPAKVCRDFTARGGSAEVAKARKSMACLVNYARTRKGLRKYRITNKLIWSARRKSKDILRCGFSHGACGRQFDFWIKRSGYLGQGGWTTGENIAWGSGSFGNVRAIFKAWMRSKGHRQAILSRSFSDVGAGVIRGRFEGIEGARVWVLHFGDN